MEVEPSRATQKLEQNGSTYDFCAPGCRKAFEADPAKYLAADHKASM